MKSCKFRKYPGDRLTRLCADGGTASHYVSWKDDYIALCETHYQNHFRNDFVEVFEITEKEFEVWEVMGN